MKVLACAYACNPFHGSEEGVGWGWVNIISQRHEVWVLTAAYQRRCIEEAAQLSPNNFGNLHFVYVPEKPWHYRPTLAWTKIENSFAKPVMNWAYRLWLRDAFDLALKLHSSLDFDLTHQITYVGFRFPGHLSKLGVPFVWGPIGGLENTRWRLLASMGTRGFVYYAARNIVNSAHKRYLRGPRLAFGRAKSGVIAATSGIQAEITRWYGVPSDVICEIGTPPESPADYSIRNVGEPLRLVWSGRHVPGKALQLLLYALAALKREVDWSLDIYGDGPCRVRWSELAERLGIAQRCTWRGQVARSEVIRGLHSSHLCIITSLKELTSSVTLEAIAQGVPVICPDHCGFRDAITDECGVKLPIGSVREFRVGLARVIKDLASNEERRRGLAEGALRRARDFSWESKAEAVETVYQRAINAQVDRDMQRSAGYGGSKGYL